jgi:AcrR family transcriptional regulator
LPRTVSRRHHSTRSRPKARVTKGAVYHHFESKQQLFEAVFAREVARLASLLPTVCARKKDPWDALQATCRAYLEECLDPHCSRSSFLT